MPTTHHGILIHVVFSTKQRFKLLKSAWRNELFVYIGGITKENKSMLLKAGGVEDHVHLLLKMSPAYSISETVKLIKGNSSRWINEQRKVNARFSWQRGYGAFSVSESQMEIVGNYIANQETHHLRRSFEDEYLELLKKHRIEFDPKYVFDDEVVA